MLRKVIVLLLGVALVAGVLGLNHLRTRPDGQALLHVATAAALPVLTVTPQTQTVVRTVQAPGEIEAVTTVEIRSEIAARIEEMPVEEGDAVDAGELLCQLNDDQFAALVESGEASAARLEASIRQAKADLEKTQRDCARQEELARIEAVSDTELADYRTMLIKSQAAVEMRMQELAEARAMLRQARENLAKTVITSPLRGVVSRIAAKPGEVVITGTMNNPGTVIMVVSDLSRMQVRARVDETDVPMVSADQPAGIYLPAEPDRSIPGRVLRVATSGTKPLGRDVVTFETLVLVESNHPGVKPGMTANVEIQVARKDSALTVPVQAIVHRKRKDLPENLVQTFIDQQRELGLADRPTKAQYLAVVFCMVDDKAQPRLVRTGIADQNQVEVLEGLADADLVIVGPYRSLDQLKEGSVVKLEETKKPGPADKDTQLAEPSASTPPVETDDTTVTSRQ